jgi:Sap, sulfolipid-1-addressing protein
MTLLELFALAVLAALYPTLLAVVILVLARPNAGRLLAFFLAGAALTSISIGLFAVLVLDPGSLDTNRRSFGAGVSLAAGFVALLVGLHLLRPAKPKEKHEAKDPTHRSFSQRALEHDSAWLVFVLGIVLDLPGVWYLIGLRKIIAGGYSDAEAAALVVGFNVIMFAFVEVPLVGFLVAPERTNALVERFNAWLRQNVRHLLAWLALAVAAYLIVRGVIGLV